MNNIINNKVSFFGDFDDVQDIIKKINGEESQLDFNKIEPMEKDYDDLALDQYMNLCLNIYLKNQKEYDRDKLINTFKFVGRTRRKPYEFRVLTDEQINSAKVKYQTKKIEEDTKFFIERIKNKSIFNSYIIRETLWGTGTEPICVKLKDNRLEFKTYDKVPLKIFQKISKICNKVKINYCYEIKGKVTKLNIINGKIRYVIDENQEYNEPNIFSLISQNVAI